MVTNPEGDWEELVVCFGHSHLERSGGANGAQTVARTHLGERFSGLLKRFSPRTTHDGQHSGLSKPDYHTK
jgi:hypothetical protein